MDAQDNNDNVEKPFSLISPAAMGGIIGGEGYSFQDRYIVCHIPKWLNMPGFLRFMNEGTGDVDIVYSQEERTLYDHIQVKDHQVTPSEFSSVIKTFISIDSGTQRRYNKFILASPALSQPVSSFATALSRYREALSFYDPSDAKDILKSTEEELMQKVADLKLDKYKEFLLDKLDFETWRFDFSDNGTCRHQFTSMLTEHPEYSGYLSNIIKPVYSKLIEIVPAHRGKAFEITELHELIKAVLKGAPSASQDSVLHIHNWTKEKFNPSPTYELDWSSYFDRTTRKIPDLDIWNRELIPQLHQVRQEIARHTSNRHIIFRGKCTLSTGLVLGMAFPEIGNWTFELLQYPATWRSDALRKKDYGIRYQEVDPAQYGLNTTGDEIAVVLNITGDGLDEVIDHFKNHDLSIRQLVIICPSENPGSLSIADDIEAVSLASAAKDIVKAMTAKYRAKSTHLFYYGPLGLAIFLGQKLTSVGQVLLYEYQDPGYRQSCVVKT